VTPYELHTGDCLAALPAIPAGSVHTVVTSPPYWGLRDYGADGQVGLEATPEAYVERLVRVFREVRRVLRNDGTVWLNLGDSYTMGTRGAGGNGKQHSNAGSIITDRTWRIAPGLKPKDLVGIPWRVAFALQADGWYLRSDIIWAKPNPMPESVRDRPTKSHEYIFLLTKSERYHYDHAAIAEASVTADPRRPYTSTGAWQMDGRPSEQRHGGEMRDGENFTVRNKRSVWTVATQPYPEAHFATYPPELIRPCILAGSPEGGMVLDPFAGSGTTGLVALQHARCFIGIELNPEYVALARKRLDPIAAQPSIWEAAS
jgi:DNA modification methylase